MFNARQWVKRAPSSKAFLQSRQKMAKSMSTTNPLKQALTTQVSQDFLPHMTMRSSKHTADKIKKASYLEG